MRIKHQGVKIFLLLFEAFIKRVRERVVKGNSISSTPSSNACAFAIGRAFLVGSSSVVKMAILFTPYSTLEYFYSLWC